MDNNELENILESKFATVREPVTAPSLVPDVMRRVAAMPDLRPLRRRFEWLLALAWLLGAVVCFSAFQGLDFAGLMGLFEGVFGDVGSYLGQYEAAATQIAVALTGAILLSPLVWLMLED